MTAMLLMKAKQKTGLFKVSVSSAFFIVVEDLCCNPVSYYNFY